MTTGNSNRIREYARREYIEPARKRGATKVQVVAGDVERALGLRDRAAQVCTSLGGQKFLRESRIEIEKVEGPPKKSSTTTKFTYRILDTDPATKSAQDDPLMRLWGIGKRLFDAPGEWEASIRNDREHFYGSGKEP